MWQCSFKYRVLVWITIWRLLQNLNYTCEKCKRSFKNRAMWHEVTHICVMTSFKKTPSSSTEKSKFMSPSSGTNVLTWNNSQDDRSVSQRLKANHSLLQHSPKWRVRSAWIRPDGAAKRLLPSLPGAAGDQPSTENPRCMSVKRWRPPGTRIWRRSRSSASSKWCRTCCLVVNV